MGCEAGGGGELRDRASELSLTILFTSMTEAVGCPPHTQGDPGYPPTEDWWRLLQPRGCHAACWQRRPAGALVVAGGTAAGPRTAGAGRVGDGRGGDGRGRAPAGEARFFGVAGERALEGRGPGNPKIHLKKWGHRAMDSGTLRSLGAQRRGCDLNNKRSLSAAAQADGMGSLMSQELGATRKCVCLCVVRSRARPYIHASMCECMCMYAACFRGGLRGTQEVRGGGGRRGGRDTPSTTNVHIPARAGVQPLVPSPLGFPPMDKEVIERLQLAS